MGKNKNKKSGGELFNEYYGSLYGNRWDKLKESLFLDPVYFNYRYSEDLPEYFLDSGSVLAALSLPLENAENILDLCAAPGGKTLVIARNMKKDASLTSNEFSKDRYVRLKNVVANHLPEDVQKRIRLTAFDGATWCKFEGEVYDALLLDAPCSSEKHVLNDEKYLSLWTPARVKNLSIKQWSLLSSAFRVLKPGGYLLYSTCALARDENDGVLARLFKKFPNAEKIKPDFEAIYAVYPDLPVPEETALGYHVMPDKNNGAGPLFFSLIKKNETVID